MTFSIKSSITNISVSVLAVRRLSSLSQACPGLVLSASLSLIQWSFIVFVTVYKEDERSSSFGSSLILLVDLFWLPSCYSLRHIQRDDSLMTSSTLPFALDAYLFVHAVKYILLLHTVWFIVYIVNEIQSNPSFHFLKFGFRHCISLIFFTPLLVPNFSKRW